MQSMIEFKSNKSVSWLPMLMLLVAKSMRGGALLIGNNFMNKFSFSIISFLFYVLLITTPIAFVIAKPKIAELWKKKWSLIFHSILFVAHIFLWSVGLKYFGAIKTILAFDYGSILISQIIYQLGDSSKQDVDQLKGVFCMSAAYIMLLFIDTPAHTTTQTLQEVIQSPGQVSEGISLVFGVAEKKIGAMAVFLCLLIELLRKSVSKKLSSQLGGNNQMFAGTSAISFVISLILVIIYPLLASTNTTNTFEINAKVSFFEEFGGILFFALFVVLGDNVVEPFVRTKIKKPLFVTIPAISISYISVFLIELWNGTNTSSFTTFISFLLVLVGIYFIHQNQDHLRDSLPMYGSTNYSSSKNPVISFFKNSVSIIWKDSASRKIFIFLCANLSFMFIEMIYGFLSNSLGLISDAFHMLFDCTALGIGLYASIISKWDANGSFSYGYARVEILSGFVNGVFLLFIGFFVLIESLQRLVEPPEVRSERLILVSVLGFIVNMIGLYAFHDHSGHGHSHGGHGHSHGHSHAHGTKKVKHDEESGGDHGHSHSHKKKDKHKDEHSHSHSHKKDKHKHDHEHDSHNHDDEHCDDHDHSHGHGHSHSHKKDKHKDEHSHSHKKDKHKDEHSHSHSHKKDKHDHDHDHDSHDHDDEHCDDHDHSHGHGHSHSQRKSSIILQEHHDEDDHSHSHSHSHTSGEDLMSYSRKISELHFDLDEANEDEKEDNHYENENMKGIFLHVLADTLGSVGVIISSSLIYFFDWKIADAICSSVMSVLILLSTIPLLQSTASTLLQGSPGHLSVKLRNGLRSILKIKNILSIKNPHFWTLAGESVVGTIEIVVDKEANDQAILSKVSSILTDVGVTNITIQINKD